MITSTFIQLLYMGIFKSVSSFSDIDYGIYGVNNEGVIVGLENQQVDTDFISEMTKARLALYQKYSLYRLSTKGISLLSYELKRIHMN